MKKKQRPYQNFWGTVKRGKNCSFGGFVDIGDGVEFGDNCKVECFVSIPPGWKIGNNVFIGPGVHFANDKYPTANGPWTMLHEVVQDNVSIGMGALIGAGIIIGKYAVIGQGANVIKDVPPYTTVVGNPAMPLGSSQASEFPEAPR